MSEARKRKKRLKRLKMLTTEAVRENPATYTTAAEEALIRTLDFYCRMYYGLPPKTGTNS